jgi:hypothetical protein
MQFKITHKKLTLALLRIDITSIYSMIVIRFITLVDENLRNFFEIGDYFSFGFIPDNSLLIM